MNVYVETLTSQRHQCVEFDSYSSCQRILRAPGLQGAKNSVEAVQQPRRKNKNRIRVSFIWSIMDTFEGGGPAGVHRGDVIRPGVLGIPMIRCLPSADLLPQ